MRYVWDNCHEYIKSYNIPWILKKLAQKLPNLRLWDKWRDRVDFLSPTQTQNKGSILQAGLEVIYPMVDTDRFKISKNKGVLYSHRPADSYKGLILR